MLIDVHVINEAVQSFTIPDIRIICWNVVFCSWIKVIRASINRRSYSLIFTPVLMRNKIISVNVPVYGEYNLTPISFCYIKITFELLKGVAGRNCLIFWLLNITKYKQKIWPINDLSYSLF